MGFFASFWTWLNTQLGTYIGDNTARVAAAMEPALVTLATMYVMVWGYLQLTGRIEEPFVTGLKRILTIAVVLGVALRMWLYNTVIVDTFYQAPAQLAAAVIGTSDPVRTIDSIWDRGGSVAAYLWNNGGVFNDEFGFYIAGVVVWVFMGLLCVYTMFLIALSHVALAVLLAFGPVLLRNAVVRDNPAPVRCLARTTGQLCADYHIDRHGGGAVAADRRLVRGANGCLGYRHCDRRCVEHGSGRGPRVPVDEAGHADCGEPGRWRLLQHVWNCESRG